MWSPADPASVGSFGTPAATRTRGREQEREARRALVTEPGHEPADHRDARTADTGQQREDLEPADDDPSRNDSRAMRRSDARAVATSSAVRAPLSRTCTSGSGSRASASAGAVRRTARPRAGSGR